jgi:hypothetical protein
MKFYLLSLCRKCSGSRWKCCFVYGAPRPHPPKPSIPLPAMWILPSLKRWLCQKMRQCATSKKCKFLYVNIVWILIRIQLNLDGGWGRWGDIVSLGCLSFEYNVHVHWLQGFGSVSGSGSACIRSNLSCWIRIHIQIVDPDPRWQNWTKELSKGLNFHLLVQDVLFWGLKASPVGLASFMEA